jgi:hypothetical protein
MNSELKEKLKKSLAEKLKVKKVKAESEDKI